VADDYVFSITPGGSGRRSTKRTDSAALGCGQQESLQIIEETLHGGTLSSRSEKKNNILVLRKKTKGQGRLEAGFRVKKIRGAGERDYSLRLDAVQRAKYSRKKSNSLTENCSKEKWPRDKNSKMGNSRGDHDREDGHQKLGSKNI